MTAEQLEGLRALANRPSLTWVIASWKLSCFRGLLDRLESAEALVSTLAARFAAHPELLKLALTTGSAAVGSPPAGTRTHRRTPAQSTRARSPCRPSQRRAGRVQARLDKLGWWKNAVGCWERNQSTTEKMLESNAGAVRLHQAAPVPRLSEPRFPVAAPHACKHAPHVPTQKRTAGRAVRADFLRRTRLRRAHERQGCSCAAYAGVVTPAGSPAPPCLPSLASAQRPLVLPCLLPLRGAACRAT